MWWNAPDEPEVSLSRRAACPAVILLAAVVVAAVVVAAVTLTAPPSGAAPIDDARSAVTAAQRAADTATASYEESVTRLGELRAEIDDVRVRIEADRAEASRLRAVARERAVRAYIGHDGLEQEGGFVLEGGDPLDEVRREKLLARTKERDDAAVADLAAVTRDLARQRDELDTRRAEQEGVVAQLQAEQSAVEAQLHDAQVALDALEEQLRREQEAARARELAAAVAREASNRANGKDYSGSFVATGIVCPIRGALSFVDSWLAPRHQGAHQGVDLMAAVGTPDVAVVSGTVDFEEGGLSGLGAYLHGDDGNLYYYFHLSAYEGTPRRVAQGEVIGHVGNTGDARYTASHTHFEIHPGGGAAVNPYPSVAAVC
jgi:murein DD-endopeptidase MepM/ murein hydrolase activator NlpD